MKSILFTIALFSFGATFSQSVDKQYDSLINKSETFKDYKVIKITELNSFWKNVMDSVNNQKQTIAELKMEVDNQNKKIATQSSEIETLKNRITELEGQTSSIEVIGIDTDKTVFKVVVLAFSTALIAIIGFLLFQLKDKLTLAKTKVKDYQSLEIKYEEFRKSALEKQMKLRRDLQTERNRLEEISS